MRGDEIGRLYSICITTAVDMDIELDTIARRL